MTDDAHGIGVVGGGRGSAYRRRPAGRDSRCRWARLSKAIGSYGGYLCASREVIDLMHNRARTLIYSTGLPPAAVAAAIAALDIIESEPDYAGAAAREGARLHPRRQSARCRERDRAGDDRRRRRRDCRRGVPEDEGFLVIAIHPPTVPDGTALLRVTFNAAQPDDEIARLAPRAHPHSDIGNRTLHMPAIFITATGIDVGKTFVAAGLIRLLRWKPTRSMRSSRSSAASIRHAPATAIVACCCAHLLRR